MTISLRVGIRRAGNAGLVTTTAGPDLCHTLTANRTAIIRKIMWYNPNAANVTLIFGTQNNVAAWVPMLPTIVTVGLLDGERLEEELPDTEFLNDRAPAAGMTGNILVQANGLNVLITIEVEEFGV